MFSNTIPNEVVFNTLRILKQANPGDLYLENYLIHLRQHGRSFYDTYHVMWQIGIEFKPRTIMEIGVRTGISVCQLLSAFIHDEYDKIERVVLCDLFSDGFCSPRLVEYNLHTLGIPDSVRSKVEFLTGDSKKEIPRFIQDNPEQTFDYILVDGSHDVNDARVDLNTVHPIVSVGGFIVFDDLSPTGMMLKPVWDAFKADHFKEYEWFENLNGKGVGVGRKVKEQTKLLSEDVS